MTQQEKDSRHLKKQNRRLRRLILNILLPLLYVQILGVPVLGCGLMERLATPSAPLEVTLSECRWEGSNHKSLVVYSKERSGFMVARNGRTALWEDVKNGALRPGDRLTVTLYPWIFRDAAATVAYRDKVYGDMESWEAVRREDAAVCFGLYAILIFLALAVSCLLWYCSRAELAEIRKLRRKYRKRMEAE